MQTDNSRPVSIVLCMPISVFFSLSLSLSPFLPPPIQRGTVMDAHVQLTMDAHVQCTRAADRDAAGRAGGGSGRTPQCHRWAGVGYGRRDAHNKNHANAIRPPGSRTLPAIIPD